MARMNIETAAESLVNLVNNYLDDTDMYLYEGEYIKLSFGIYSDTKLQNILHELKFTSVGSLNDYPDLVEEQDTINEGDIYIDPDKMYRVYISEKYKAVIMYTVYRHYIEICGVMDRRFYRKFNKKLSPILKASADSGIFTDYDFKCKKREYIEISDVINESDRDRGICIQKKKVNKENLVFVEDSSIYEIMQDITLFFEKDTKKMYDKMNIAYKRGTILYGNPGNGKTAMIREIIRTLSDVSIINISPNTPRIPFIISELINELHQYPALIIIEDIDGVLNNYNRSEFLNVLDGLNVKSGVYFIGTTNYPEKIDPAFVNRSGRFDRMFEVGNPAAEVRRQFFENANIEEILSGHTKCSKDSENKKLSIVDLFIKYSDDLSMADLKELMVSTKYMLITHRDRTIEDCLSKVYDTLKTIKSSHTESFNSYNSTRIPSPMPISRRRYDDFE